MPEELRRDRVEQAEKQIAEAQAKARNASTNLKSVEELYKAREQEIQEQIKTSISRFENASADARDAESILAGLKSNITGLMSDAIENHESKRRIKSFVVGVVLGVLTSLLASGIIFLITGTVGSP
ncbi:MAG: hypothetical protein LC785_13705 [Acidobacteria bacterium]|nr:hypothetical protein [Acidobacteriota bacterium]